MSLRIAILHNHVPEDASAADRDVLVQVAAVEQACRQLGHTTWRLDCTLNLHAVHLALAEDRPDVVFNLVESLAGSDRLASLLPALLESLELRFTGSSARAIDLSNCKPAAKFALRSLGLPTPDWIAPDLPAWPAQGELQPPYIVKAIWEHASLGIDDGSLVASNEGGDVLGQIARRRQALRCPCFAEAFIAGREFNLSLLASDAGVQVLPPAEIDFSGFPADKPQIVGYAAKWDESAVEYQQTPRRFDFPPEDAELLERLGLLARRSWDALGLQGYARVDFRVAENGNPYILEVNTNPCLSPDAGFAAALTRGGITFEHAVERMLRQALAGKEEIAGKESSTGENVTRGLASPARQDLEIVLRTEPRPEDRQTVRTILESTGLFRPGEVDVAEELVDEYLQHGPQSGYRFVFAELNGQTLGYTCFGHDSMTVSSYDLYWIAVHQSHHGRGIGRILLLAAEEAIRAAGGTRVYIETSGRADYVSTRGFYLRCGYELEALFKDYYAPADGKIVYVKAL